MPEGVILHGGVESPQISGEHSRILVRPCQGTQGAGLRRTSRGSANARSASGRAPILSPQNSAGYPSSSFRLFHGGIPSNTTRAPTLWDKKRSETRKKRESYPLGYTGSGKTDTEGLTGGHLTSPEAAAGVVSRRGRPEDARLASC